MPPPPHDLRFAWRSPQGVMVHGRGSWPSITALEHAVRDARPFLVGPEEASIVADTSDALFYTRSGGTTGPAKTIRRTHASWIASFDVNQSVLGLTGADKYGVLGDIAHSLALYGVLEGAHLGTEVHSFSGLRPREQANALRDAEITVLYTTPTQLRLLCNTGIDLPSLRNILCGGGRLDAALFEQIQSACPNAQLREFYGASETSFIAWGGRGTPLGSVGQAYPHVSIRIDAPQGQTGEIWVKSPYLFDGYANGGCDETRWSDGYLAVGEIGRLDARGHLTVLGRKNRMVTIADQNVFPEDIESYLLGWSQVRHCAVMPRVDPVRGSVLVAVIQGEGTVDLREACRQHFGPLASPRAFYWHEDFPLTVAGKPDLSAIGIWLEDQT
ncbi:AMP-binding protein [Donghicola sp. XS_ASV15]|uniref:AMP-binding protein n=1 Tax=Donghicola sp. XS_ASV15 TaxID=3241295 RepID=UPI0035166957